VDVAEGLPVAHSSAERGGSLVTIVLELEVPLRTVSALNERRHWSKRAARVAMERRTVWLAIYKRFPPAMDLLPLQRLRAAVGAGPWRVVMRRRSPGNTILDDDNLAGALKGVRDELAEWLGVDDGDVARVTWAREQLPKGPWAVQVEIETAAVVEIAARPPPTTTAKPRVVTTEGQTLDWGPIDRSRGGRIIT
jgi:hypothetical protein